MDCQGVETLATLAEDTEMETEMQIMRHSFLFRFYPFLASLSISFHLFPSLSCLRLDICLTYPEVWPSGTTYVEFDSAKDLSNEDTVGIPFGSVWCEVEQLTVAALRLRCLRKTSLARSSLSRSMFGNVWQCLAMFQDVPRERDK